MSYKYNNVNFSPVKYEINEKKVEYKGDSLIKLK